VSLESDAGSAMTQKLTQSRRDEMEAAQLRRTFHRFFTGSASDPVLLPNIREEIANFSIWSKQSTRLTCSKMCALEMRSFETFTNHEHSFQKDPVNEILLAVTMSSG
jgi:hypothetical protein